MEKSIFLNPKVCKIEYIETKDVNSIHNIKNECLIKFNNSNTFKEFYTSSGTTDFTFPKEESIYKCRISGFFPGLISECNKALDSYTNKYFIIMVTMNSGEKYIMGDLENPCQFDFSFQSSKGGSDFNFYVNSEHPPLTAISI